MKSQGIPRTLKRIIKSTFPALCFLLAVHNVVKYEGNKAMDLPSSLKFFDLSSLPRNGRYERLFLPYLVDPLIEEILKEKGLIKEVYPTRSFMYHVTLTTPSSVNEYIERNPPKAPVIIAKENYNTTTVPPFKNLEDYYNYLKNPRFTCKKLVRMGGTMSCNEEKGNGGLDGHKYICMDPSMDLALSRDPSTCLTLSYGIQFDDSFDEAVADLCCDVHMFDILDFDPRVARENPNVFFHVEGLARETRTNFYSNLNRSVAMNNVMEHMYKYDLAPRPINILKIDIEGAEWEALMDLASQPVFQVVGQIAIELHMMDFVQGLQDAHMEFQKPEQFEQVLEQRYKILMGLEALGFRHVLYWDNVQDKYALHGADGTRYESAGEVLFVNKRWYNSTYKKLFMEQGVSFNMDIEDF